MISDYICPKSYLTDDQDKSPFIRRALVVCGHKNMGTKIALTLEEAGLSVDLVCTGLEAMKLIHMCCPYDIIITELLLDEISGFALASVAGKFQDVATIGINNGNTCAKIIADEYGIDKVLDPPLNLVELCNLSLKILGWPADKPMMAFKNKVATHLDYDF